MTGEFDLGTLAELAPEDVLRELETSRSGLSSVEAARRKTVFGPNEIAGERKIRPVFLFLSKLRSPLLIILLIAAVISGFLGSAFDSVVIVFIVFGSTFIDFLNTYKSSKAAAKLKERVNITAAIWRDKELSERKTSEVVPGDVFSLSAGDLVPADGILIEEKDVFVNEGVLTGESVPREKNMRSPESRTLCMGTSVVSGRGLAVAVRTGARTEIGSIVGRLKQNEPPTEFDKNIKDFSLFIFRITLFLVLAILLFNVLFERKSLFETFLFAVAIAVGITPELLPMIITANLAKGAIKMSNTGVIVKKLSAIHDFGSIDVLCTDKTGTLTEDRIDLVKYVDGFGNPSDDVLSWGYLGTVHLTNVRDVLDHAIQEYTARRDLLTSDGKKFNTGSWEKIDELPFDAERRRDSVIVRHGKETVLVTKGAPEEIFSISSAYGSSAEKMTATRRKAVRDEYEKLSSEGFRVLAIATKDVERRTAYAKSDESGMTFRGFLAFLDPPKKTAKETIRKMMEHNVSVKIITGDNHLVTAKIARDINFEIKGVLTSDDLTGLAQSELRRKVETANVFTRVSPEQKQEIIRALRANGHVVGYMGDGVNDALSLKEADVGISVNNAVDIAKDTADIILIRKGLAPIIDGVVEGRKTFANTFKYLMMALSSNFGNMFSMPVASIFLPFLPMTASQILLNNFLYDSSQLAIPFDGVDRQFLRRAKKMDMRFMKKFMIIFGPVSSLFDFVTFFVLLRVFGFVGPAFQTGWFLESIATQTLVVNVIRSRESFFKNVPSKVIAASSVGVFIFAWTLPFIGGAGKLFDFARIGFLPLIAIGAIVVAYLFAVEFVKKYFYAKYGGLIER